MATAELAHVRRCGRVPTGRRSTCPGNGARLAARGAFNPRSQGILPVGVAFEPRNYGRSTGNLANERRNHASLTAKLASAARSSTWRARICRSTAVE